MKSLSGSQDSLLDVNILTLSIVNMPQTHLSVSSDKFKIMVDGSLEYKGHSFPKENYCIDFSTDYCTENLNISERTLLKAIISDEALFNRPKMTSVFGSAKLDGKHMKLFKKIVFSISVFSLLLTIIIHCVMDDIRKEMVGKMVIGMATSMTGLYTCLLARTIQENQDSDGNKYNADFVSTSNPACYMLGNEFF